MTLQQVLNTYTQNWIKNSIVKIFNFYIVHIGDGILYCGTKKHLKQVQENNTLVYKLYNYLQH